MAKIYDNFQPANLMSFAKSFARLNGQPLDKSEIWYSYDEAAAYAATASAYVGQILAVIDTDNEKVVFYGIQDAAGTLKEVGSTPVGDESSVVIVDGKIQLKNFGTHYYAYVPAVKDEDGNVVTASTYVLTEGFKSGLEARIVASEDGFELAWYEPGTETVEDVAMGVEGLTKDVEALDNVLNAEGGLVDQVDELQEAVGSAADEAGNAASGLFAEIERIDEELLEAAEILETKANKADVEEELKKKANASDVEDALAEKADAADVYTKDETYSKSEVNAAIAAANHLKRVVVASKEAIDATATDADQYIYMVPTGLEAEDDKYDEYLVIDGSVEKVGSWEVNLEPYATYEYVNGELAKKVNSAEGYRLMAESEGEKLAGVEAGAQVNYINDSSDEFKVTEGLLEVNEIAKSKISGLTTDLANLDQAIKDEASRAALAEEGLAGEIDGLVGDLAELEGIVNGLDEELDTKVDKVEGSRLITTDEATKLEKLVLENGQITVSGIVNASNVKELYDAVHKIVVQSGTAIFDGTERTLLGIQPGAEVNIIASTTTEFAIDANRQLSLNVIDADKLVNLADNEVIVAISDKVEQNILDIAANGAAIQTNVTNIATNAANIQKNVEAIAAVDAKASGNAAAIVSLDQRVTPLETDMIQLKADRDTLMEFKTVTEQDLQLVKEILTWKEISSN